MTSQLNSKSLKDSIEECFGEIPDSRIQKKTAHKLIDIIAISILAIICGADSWSAIETYGRAKQNWLSTFLELENGIPSHDTFARVISRLEAEILEKSFQKWISQLTGQLGIEVVAIDGKTLKGSYDRKNSLKALQMVSAWSSSHRLVFGQVVVELVFSQERIEQWQGLKTLVIEESKRTLGNKETLSTRFFLSSLDSQYDCFATAIRSHWGIEKRCIELCDVNDPALCEAVSFRAA